MISRKFATIEAVTLVKGLRMARFTQDLLQGPEGEVPNTVMRFQGELLTPLLHQCLSADELVAQGASPMICSPQGYPKSCPSLGGDWEHSLLRSLESSRGSLLRRTTDRTVRQLTFQLTVPFHPGYGSDKGILVFSTDPAILIHCRLYSSGTAGSETRSGSACLYSPGNACCPRTTED